METIHTTSFSKIIPSSIDLHLSCYQYTAYIMEYTSQLTATSSTITVLSNKDSVIRVNYDINAINAEDVIYYDFKIKLNNSYSSFDMDFNDFMIKDYNIIKIDNNTIRIFGLYKVTEYDISGTTAGRLADYNKMRFFDIHIFNNTEPSILESYIFKNPTIHNGPFVDFLQIPNLNFYTTFYNISAVDLAGNISKPTYALITK